MELQAKKKSFWGTFKNAYLKSRNLKKFWKNFDKKNLSKEVIDTFDIYLNSESYSWSAKIWRHTIMNHLKIMSELKQKNYENLIMQEYFTFTYFNLPPFCSRAAPFSPPGTPLPDLLLRVQSGLVVVGCMRGSWWRRCCS